MLTLETISKSFGKKKVLDSLSMSLRPGRIYGLIGVNGAGKSTLMKILVGLVSRDEGEILLDGAPLDREKTKIGFMIEDPCFYPSMSGRDNLRLIARLFDEVGDKEVDAAIEAVGLSKRAEDPYKNYSLGMKHRLYFALAILNDPDILILDEPFNGVDPMTLVTFEKIISSFAKKGAYVLVSSHGIRELQSLADGAFILSQGKVLFQTENVKSVDLFSEFLGIEKNEGGLSLP